MSPALFKEIGYLRFTKNCLRSSKQIQTTKKSSISFNIKSLHRKKKKNPTDYLQTTEHCAMGRPKIPKWALKKFE